MRGFPWSAALLLVLGIAGAPAAQAGTAISYQRFSGNTPDTETLGGTTVRPSDLVDVDTAALVFDEFANNPFSEDLDAAYIRPNGNIIFSTDTNVDQAFPGLPNGFLNGDMVEWDGTEGSIFFEESKFTGGGNPNISAFHLFESGPNAGKFVVGTKGADDVLGGMALEWGNLLLYDPDSNTSTLFFDQDLISGTLTQKNVDALAVLPSGDLLLSTFIDNGTLGVGGLQLLDEDLVLFDPVANTASVFLDGTGIYDGNTRNLDAAHVPEPGTLLLVGIGLAGLAGGHRRRRKNFRLFG